MEDVLRADRRGADAGLGEGQVLGDRRVEVVADHQHVEVFLGGVDGVGPGRVGGAGQHVRLGDHGHDVRRVPAARTLGVVGVDAASGDGGEGVADEPGLVQRVGVDGDLDPGAVGDGERGVDDGRGRAPVLVQFEAQRAAADLGHHRVVRDGVALAEETDVQRVLLHRRHHPGQMPGTRCHGGRLGALGGSGAAADQGGDPGGEGLVGDLRADEVDVRVDGTGREDASVAGDDLGLGADHQVGVDAVHGVGVAGLADAGDPAVADADVGLDDAPVVDDHGTGDHGVGGALRAGGTGLSHGLADDLAAAEHGLVTGESWTAGTVLLDLDQQIGVGEPDAVTGGRPEQVRVRGTRDLRHRGHLRSPRAVRARHGRRPAGRVRRRRGFPARSARPYRRRC